MIKLSNFYYHFYSALNSTTFVSSYSFKQLEAAL